MSSKIRTPRFLSFRAPQHHGRSSLQISKLLDASSDDQKTPFAALYIETLEERRLCGRTTDYVSSRSTTVPKPRPTCNPPIENTFLSSASLPFRTAGFLPIKLFHFVEKCLSSQGAPDRALHDSTDAIAIPAQSSWMEDDNKDRCPDELGIVWSFIGPYAASLSPGAFIDALPDVSAFANHILEPWRQDNLDATGLLAVVGGNRAST